MPPGSFALRSPPCLTAVQLQGSGAHDTHGCGALDSRFQIRAGPSGWTLEHGIACVRYHDLHVGRVSRGVDCLPYVHALRVEVATLVLDC